MMHCTSLDVLTLLFVGFVIGIFVGGFIGMAWLMLTYPRKP